MVEPVAPWPPVAGFYATTLVKHGPRVPVRIWFGPPVINGEELDRSPRWNVEADGRTDRWEEDTDADYRCRVSIEVDRFWPYVAREPITATEYAYLARHSAWAKEHQPNHPKASPYKAVDFNTLPMRF